MKTRPYPEADVYHRSTPSNECNPMLMPYPADQCEFSAAKPMMSFRKLLVP